MSDLKEQSKWIKMGVAAFIIVMIFLITFVIEQFAIYVADIANKQSAQLIYQDYVNAGANQNEALAIREHYSKWPHTSIYYKKLKENYSAITSQRTPEQLSVEIGSIIYNNLHKPKEIQEIQRRLYNQQNISNQANQQYANPVPSYNQQALTKPEVSTNQEYMQEFLGSEVQGSNSNIDFSQEQINNIMSAPAQTQ